MTLFRWISIPTSVPPSGGNALEGGAFYQQSGYLLVYTHKNCLTNNGCLPSLRVTRTSYSGLFLRFHAAQTGLDSCSAYQFTYLRAYKTEAPYFLVQASRSERANACLPTYQAARPLEPV